MKTRKKKSLLLVLLIEIGHINNQILDNIHMRQRSYHGGGASVGVDRLQTSHRIRPVNVHRTRPAYPFPTRSPVAEARIILPFNLLQRIKNHGPTFGEVDEVGLEEGLPVRVIGAPPVNLEFLVQIVDALFQGVVRFQDLLRVLCGGGVAFQSGEVGVFPDGVGYLFVSILEPAFRHYYLSTFSPLSLSLSACCFILWTCNVGAVVVVVV